MKIKNLKYGLTALALAVTLTGCGSNYRIEKLESTIESLEDENQKLREEVENANKQNEQVELVETVDVEQENLEDNEELVSVEVVEPLSSLELSELESEINDELRSYYSFYYSDYTGKLEISKKTYVKDDDYQISDEVYSNINKILKQSSALELKDLDSKFDLSRLDIKNLDEIKFDNIDFVRIKPLLLESASNEIKVSLWSSYYFSGDDIVNYLDFLIENQVKLDSMYVNISNCDAFSKIHDKLQNLNVETLFLNVFTNNVEIKDVFNIKTKLNDNTHTFYLDFMSYNEHYQDYYYDLKQLGNIDISSDYSSDYSGLDIQISGGLVTENTKFLINSDCYDITLWDADYTDIEPLYDLRDARMFTYHNIDSRKTLKYCNYNYFTDDGFKIYDTQSDEISEYHNATFDEAIDMIQEIKGTNLVKKK